MATGENNNDNTSLNESEALQKIREQAHFIRSVTDAIPGIVAINSYPPGEVIFNNRDALEMLGFDADELVAMGYQARLTLIFPEDLPALKAYYDRFENLPDNAENRVEYRIKNKNGNLIWLDARGRVFRRDGNGRVIQILQIAQDVTEQKKAAQEILQLKEEVALRANDKYHAIINSIDEGFCVIEVILNEAGKPVDLVYLETNRIFQQQTGLGDVVGRRLRDVLPNIEQGLIDFYGNVALTGEPERIEYYIESLGRWFSVYASSVGGGNNLQLAVVFNDITDRKHREQRQEYLLKLNDALRSLADPLAIESAVTRLAMDYFKAHRCYYCEIVGNDAVIRQDALRGNLPSVAGTYPLSSFEVYKQIVDNGLPFIVHDSNTTNILDEALRQICLQLQVISFLNVPVVKGGKVVSLLCIVQSTPRKWTMAEIDVAEETAERIWAGVERARAEAALQKSEALLASVFKVLPVGLGFLDTEGKFRIMNEEMRRFIPTGVIPSSDDENAHRWKAYHTDGSLIEKENYPGARALRGDPLPDLEMTYVQDDGQQVWTRVAAMPFKNEKDEIIGAVIVITDINELKRTEAELKKSEQQLKALLKQKDDFIGVASHELKTPVTSIKAYAGVVQDMLNEAGLSQESDIMDRLNKQIDRLTLLISDLLDTTKISEGKINYTFEPTNINELLKERIEEVERTTTRSLDLHLDELPLVTADKERIGQVIINLLTNAIKYSKEGSVVIVKTTRVDAGIQVSVQDEGYGISEEDQLKIFDRFYRVTANNLHTYPGMGLGLYISAQIVERHGGRLEVNSTPGKGSIFFFTLPYANDALH